MGGLPREWCWLAELERGHACDSAGAQELHAVPGAASGDHGVEACKGAGTEVTVGSWDACLANLSRVG